MNIEQAAVRACEEPTLQDALAWICNWECERIVNQAFRIGSTSFRFDCSDTYFDSCVEEVLEVWDRKNFYSR